MADALNEAGDYRYGYVNPEDIRGAGFRRGLAEIEVRFIANPESDYPDEMVESIPAESVLDELLRQALREGAS